MEKTSTQQQYHLEPPYGLLNDPNGLAWFDDKLYVFFQWNRLAKDHSYKEWGLFTSGDLVNWDFQGTALLPDQIYDFKGIYSGSGLVVDGKLYLFYTGNTNWAGHRRVHQSLAISENGYSFIKVGPVLETPKGFTEHFRDPKVWKQDDAFYMILGAQKENGKGCVALCKSKDALQFEYERILADSKGFEMIECPDLIKLGEQHLLLYCPQRRDNQKDVDIGSFSCYKFCDFGDEEGEPIDLDSGWLPTDYGFDFYAPQTTELPDGRRVMFAWMSRMDEEESEVFSRDEPRIHCLTIPRELSLSNGRLLQKPLRELYGSFKKEVELKDGKARPLSRSWLMRLEETPEDLTVTVNDGEAEISYSKLDGLFKLSRLNWVTNEWESKEVKTETLKNAEVWSDTSSIEVFLNDGEYALSSRLYPKSTEPSVLVKGLEETSECHIYNFQKGGNND